MEIMWKVPLPDMYSAIGGFVHLPMHPISWQQRCIKISSQRVAVVDTVPMVSAEDMLVNCVLVFIRQSVKTNHLAHLLRLRLVEKNSRAKF